MPKPWYSDEQLTNRLRETAGREKICPPVKPLLKRYHVNHRRFWRIVDANPKLRSFFAPRRGRGARLRINDDALGDILLEIARREKTCPPITPLRKRYHVGWRRFWRIVDANPKLRRYFGVPRRKTRRVSISDDALRDTLLEIARPEKTCPPITPLRKRYHVSWQTFWRIVDANPVLRSFFALRRGRGARVRISDEALRDALLEIAGPEKTCPPITSLLKRYHTDKTRFWRIVNSDPELRAYFAVRRGKRSPAEWMRIAAAAGLGAVAPTEAPEPVHHQPPHEDRDTRKSRVLIFVRANPGLSERKVAEKTGVPASTFRKWDEYKAMRKIVAQNIPNGHKTSQGLIEAYSD